MKHIVVKADLSIGDTGEIEAVAWPFGSPDRVNDTIEPAAVADAVGKTFPMCFAHDQRDVVGIWHTVEVTADALRMKGRLLKDTVARAAEVFSLIREGAVRGVSLGFDPKKSTPRAKGGRAFTLIEILEASIVAVPCHPGAAITAVKEQDMAETETPAVETPDFAALATRLDGIAGSLDSFGNRLDGIEVKMGRPGGAKPEEHEQKLETKAFTAFVRRGVEKMPGEEVKSLRVASDTAGGFLAPAQFTTELLRNLVQFSPVRQAARVGSMTAGEIKIPRRTQSIAAQWVSEIEQRSRTEPVYGMTEIAAHEMSCYVDVSNQLLEDSAIDIAAELSFDFAEEFGRLEATAFVNGDGVKKPLGLLSDAAGIPSIPSGVTSGAMTDAQFAAALINLMYALPPAYRANGSWLMSGPTIGKVRLIKDGAGRFMWADSLAAGQPPTLLGRPVVECVDFPDIALSATPIMFGDVSAAYRIYDRVGLSVLRNPYTLDVYGQTRFTARRRVGASVVRPEALRKLKVANA